MNRIDIHLDLVASFREVEKDKGKTGLPELEVVENVAEFAANVPAAAVAADDRERENVHN